MYAQATRISCTRLHYMTACAAFSKESRMKFANANKLHRKSGGTLGTRPGEWALLMPPANAPTVEPIRQESPSCSPAQSRIARNNFARGVINDRVLECFMSNDEE
jgi:hypothetical protein